MKDLWYRFSNIGINRYQLRGKELRKTRLLNRFTTVVCLTVTVSFLFQFITHQIIKGEFNINVYLMFLSYIPLGLIYIFHTKKHFVLARVFFIVYNLLATIFWAVLIGQDAGVDRTFLVFPIAVMVFFEKFKTQFLFILLIILTYFITRFLYGLVDPFLGGNLNPLSVYPIFAFQTFLAFVLLLFHKREVNIAEENLKQKNSELEQFTRAASHDMKEPARSIAAFSSLIRSRHSNEISKQVSEYLEFIESSSKRMLDLLNDLLTYATTGVIMEKMSVVDLNNVLEESLENLDAQINDTGAQINRTDLPQINGYKNYLIQLFQNIISNGIKFQPKDQVPVLIIYTSKESRKLKITFEDNGIGIESEFLNSIFENFKRLHTKSEYDGTGLGLATCRKIVKIHNGQIGIESKPGVGTKIHLLFNI